MIEFQLDIYQFYFKISKFTENIYRTLIHRLNRASTQMGYIRRGRDTAFGVVKVYNVYCKPDQEIRYHISLLDTVRSYLREYSIDPSRYKVDKHPPTPAKDIDVPVKSGWTPRDYQVPVIDYITQDGALKFVGLGTGLGKTSVSLMAISKIGLRTLILIKPTYLEKWYFDVTNVLDVPSERINVIKGGTALQSLIELNKISQDDSDFIIMSISTFHNYMSTYEKYGKEIRELGYGCLPEDFFELCKIGVVLIDEIHQLFHQQSTAMLYMNCEKVIALSATLFSKDKYQEEKYSLVIPKEIRYKETLNEKYIYVTAISYSFHHPDKIRCTEFNSNMYSHSAYEKSIMRNPTVLNNYLNMIADQVYNGYIKRYQKGDKCLVFAGTVKMCILIRDRLREKYPDFSIEKYTQEDPYENAIEPDIRVSTSLSISTGIDIPGLTTTIMTNRIESIQSSRQAIGRLRKINNRDVHYYYLYCEQMDKHVRVHNNSKSTLGVVAKNFSERKYWKTL